MVRIFPRSIDCTATQLDLARFNARRLEPQLPHSGWADRLATDCEFLRLEGAFVDAALRHIAPLVADVPE